MEENKEQQQMKEGEVIEVKDDIIKQNDDIVNSDISQIYNIKDYTLEENKEMFFSLYEENLGIVTTICSKMNMSRRTFYNWCDEDEEFKAKIDKIKDDQPNKVEDKLLKKIEAEDTTCIIFYLKCRNKKYKPSLNLEGSLEINDYDKLTEEELKERIRKATEKLGEQNG